MLSEVRYNDSGLTGCVTTPSALTATFLCKRTVMADRHYTREEPCPICGGTLRYIRHDKCVDCARRRAAARFAAKPEECRAGMVSWAARNPETKAESVRRRAEKVKADAECRARVRQQHRQWRQEHPDRICAWVRKRQAAQLQRTPAWLTEQDHQAIEVFYAEARRLTLTTGIPHEVDHIVPLLGETVCGLHVPWNLQILTRFENRAKANRC